MQCPKCNGRLFRDQLNEWSCLNCSWSPPIAIPANIDLSGKTYPQHIASRGKAPQPWEFTSDGEYAVDARGEHPATPQPSQQRTRGGREA